MTIAGGGGEEKKGVLLMIMREGEGIQIQSRKVKNRSRQICQGKKGKNGAKEW
jgi:hypothetical protein